MPSPIEVETREFVTKSFRPRPRSHWSKTRRRFAEEVAALGLSRQTTPSHVVGEQDIAWLPESAQRFLRFMGVVGRPRDWSFRLGWKGEFRRSPTSSWGTMRLPTNSATLSRSPRGWVLGAGLTICLCSCLPRRLPPERPSWPGGPYDFRSTTRVGGEVLSVDDLRANDAAFSGVHVLLRAGQGTVSVHLGPRRFFDDPDVAIVPGDVVNVTGTPTSFEGKPAIVAKTMRKGDKEVHFFEHDASKPEAAHSDP